MRLVTILSLALVFLDCGTTAIPAPPDLRAPAVDMATAPQPDLAPAPALASVSPATVTIGADTTITLTGTNCHFDTWCDIGASTSFAPCVLNSFSTKVVDANTMQYSVSVPAGAQPANCKITIQPRVANSGGGCGPNAGPQLVLSPAFSLK